MKRSRSRFDDRLSGVASSALSRRRLLQGGAGLAAGAALTGLTDTASTDAVGAIIQGEGKGGTLVIGRGEDAQSLDPIRSGSFASGDTMALIYDTLTALDMDGNVVPNLAESWEISQDAKEYTFILREGIQFHDGTVLDANAVKAHFDRTIDPNVAGRSASWIDQLQETRVQDPRTVTLVLENPWAPLLATLPVSAFGIPSPTAVTAAGDDFGQRPVGSGPFMFKEWIPGDRITLAKNPNYRSFLPYVENKGAPFLDEVVWRVIPETQSLIAALEAGEIHLVNLPPQHVRSFTDRSGYTTYSKPEAATLTNFVEFNFFKPPFDDLKVRQAFAHAIDVDTIIATVMEGQAVRNFCFMPVGLPGWGGTACEEHGYGYDAERANALLEEAGWVDSNGDGVREKDGQALEVTMMTFSTDPFRRVVEVMQGYAAEVGFQMTIETLEVGAELATISLEDNPTNEDLINWGWPTSHLLYMMTHSDQPLGRYRQSNGANVARFEEVINQTLAELDQEKRAALYAEAETLLLQDAAGVPLYSDIYTYAAPDKVQGFAIGPLNSSSYGILVLQDTYIA
ncbi:MAG: ABC transporter substrate-binding protein [Chloroflexota bacterium]|nr:ABC transporter substrate-binding protein [Chloroflexota bacterium]